MNDICLLPDLLDGYVVNGLDSPNSWITSIQSVLISGDDCYYLSQECRSENIHYLGERDPGIFCSIPNQSVLFQVEFLSVSHAGLFYHFPQLKAETFLQSNELVHDAIRENGVFFGERKLFLPMVSKSGWTSQAFCEQREVRILAFDEVYEMCTNRCLRINEIFLKFEYLEPTENKHVALYSSMRYINFSNLSVENKYLQGINGSVLLKIEGTLVHAYMAAAFNSEGDSHIEFIVPTFDYAPGKSDDIHRDYNTVFIIAGQCSFYQYT
ncbi:hypothetical protein [Prochlorococcus marinus]|uniref:FHA domain-containing protein n=1 Tax=Prochlorococcus marinus (strain MIT 9303) TaxID=59922 RepID=A2C5P3_PROM3|nr:hypothetical protein [Prochlorococcus marinus]ABM76803.1 Hypothetical protein P9303_00461 [Prochlorococcus marinus str. MIT 9303]